MYSEEKKQELCRKAQTILLKSLHVDFISERDRKILTEIGYPCSAAPYIILCCEEDYAGHSLRDRICNFEQVDADDIEAEDAVLDNTCFLGICGIGYIVINKRGEVWILDHESFDEYYANRSLDDFLDCLYEYRMFVARMHEKYGQNVFIEDCMTKSDLEEFEKTLLSIDEEILEEDNYWWEEIQAMREAMQERLDEIQ